MLNLKSTDVGLRFFYEEKNLNRVYENCLKKFLSFVVNGVLVAWEGNDEAVGELKSLTETCIPNMLPPK